MNAAREIAHKLREFKRQVLQIIEQVIRDNQDVIVDMNAEGQLFEKGITREGESIAGYAPYATATIQIKQAKGQPTGRVTLRDEGDFHAGFYIEFMPDGFMLRSSDWKEEILTHNYGVEIMGLTDANIAELAREYVYPEVAKYFRQIWKRI